MPKTANPTLKQVKFAKEYIETSGNGTQAALNAGYNTSRRTASVIGSENLVKPCIREIIEKTCQELGFTPREALQEIIQLIKSGKPADKLKAIQLYSDCVGMSAPKQTENKNDNTVTIKENEAQQIAEISRKSLREAIESN